MVALSSEPPNYLEPLLGVVFDLDGTLVVSDQDFRRMRREVIRLAELYGVMPGHLSIQEPIPHLIQGALEEMRKASAPEAMEHRFQADVHTAMDVIEMEALPKTRARAGAAELLAALEERGFRIGLLTRSSEKFSRAALHQTGLLPYFPYLRTRSAPGPSKPSPEALLLLLNEMGVPPGRSLFVGDHRFDAECALGARVRFYGILPEPPGPDPMTVERFRAAGATAVAKDLPELGHFLRVLAPARPATTQI
ncbi:MAG: HAD family hydrolase [Thermoplasmata archaeon]|nr:HAD family hydrolase [Thermoplasmata archaeon]